MRCSARATGITLLTSSALDVKFQGGEISVTDPLFPAPFFLGLNGTLPLALGSSASADFINVLEGVSSKVWTLDTSTGALNATWTNPDGTKILPALVYDSFHNWLNFTGDPAAFIAASTSVPPPQQVSIFLV
ncbi:hypothetical protein BV25DRAFT_1697756 [Artomyces pyxidatus]|uniref:Uncharacterized protein n=1 Tax=Artomyces pyxidatus TaxID=48021 RepID=A0ACB8TAI4_9AGAM|nr:hypothetical protein BV25DRAFT_1697756 [Artomyces pyxidatus]